MNVVVWKGSCSRCGLAADNDTMYLFADLSGDAPKLEMVCMNMYLCGERAKERELSGQQSTSPA